MERFPFVPEELLEALEDRFVDQVPRQADSVLALGRAQGQQMVLDYLRQQRKRQNIMEH